jgi:primosomal protein N' (replication factor Y)
MNDIIELGSRVRVSLHGRRVGGWVVELLDRSDEVASDALKSLLKSSGLGPSADVIDLARWASERWCASRLRPFLVVASPPVVVHRPATPRRTRVVAEPTSPATSTLIERGGGVLRLPPTVDHLPTILSAARVGPTLVVCPAVDQARVLSHRLRRTGVTVALVPEDWAQARGGADVVIGARGAAFAPCPDLRVALVLDEHDEGLQEERTPTWNARDVVVERCRRVGAVPVLVSPVPSVEAWSSLGARGESVVAPDRDRERRSWPELETVDLSEQEPWKRSLVSSRLIEELRDDTRRVVCVVNAKGQARTSACRSCRTLARCALCEAAVVEIDQNEFACPRCDTRRPRVCAACGSTTMARVRPGTARLREELERASLRRVLEVTASSDDVDDTGADVFVGTEAVLHRVRRADTVVFLDVDSELLAPRFRSREQMWALVARAARLVGSSGRVVLQTTLVDHDTVRAMVELELDRAVRDEWERRRALDLPPLSTLAVIEGDELVGWAAELSSAPGVHVTGLGERLLVRAVDWRRLADAWESARLRLDKDARTRRVRIAVDPLRV